MKFYLHVYSYPWFITLICTFCLPFKLQSQEIGFKKITAKDGISHSTVYDVAQDDDGLMWFGTREGLNSFDGTRITTFYHNDTLAGSISDNQINVLQNTSNGLYVGTYSGLDRYRPQKQDFEHILTFNEIRGSVNQIFESSNLELFTCTTNGLFKIDIQGNKYHYLKKLPVRDIVNYKTNVYWVALNRRILLINNTGEIIREYGLPDSPLNKSDGSVYVISTIFKDREDILWLATTRGLFYFNQAKDDFVHVNISDNIKIEAEVIRTIKQDETGLLWIGTESGVFVYNKKTGKSVNYTQSFSSQPQTLSDKSVYSIYISKEQIVWIGTYFGGVNYTNPKSKGIFSYLPSDYTNSISGKAVSEITQLSNGEIWIGTEDGGISILDKPSDKFRYFSTKDGLSSNNIHSIHEDNQGYIWIGTFLGGLNRYNRKTGKIQVLQFRKNDSSSISNNYIYAIHQDQGGSLWIGTQFGLNVYNYEANSFSLFIPQQLGDKFIYDILEDHLGVLWFCTRNSGIYKYNPKTNELNHLDLKNTSGNVHNGQIVSAYEDHFGTIWFGTLSQGILKYDRATNQIKPFSFNRDLPNNNVYGIVEDNNGKIWISTNQGLSIFDPATKSMNHLGVEDGLTTNQFNFKSSFKDDEGLLYFGSVNGLNIINTEELDIVPDSPPIHLTGFSLYNRDVPITKDGLLQKHIDYLSELELSYNQDVFSIEYGAIDYLKEGSLKYAYKLEGFDKNWNLVGSKNTATYTNLSPGEYLFKVKTLPLETSKNERNLRITIMPPFWKTDGAYFIYFLIVIVLVYAYWRFVRFVHHQKLAVQLERVEKEKIKELNKHKLNFFTFISHEFKTPLTLIIASVEKFFREKVNHATPPEELVSIRKSADKLNQLIHQLLEFRKIETDHAKIDLKKGDIILFLRDTFQAFEPLFQLKNMEYQFKTDVSEYECYFDPSKVEMIATNLISNALKNTQELGQIKLYIAISNTLDSQKRSTIVLYFTDTGLGMSEELVEKVTEPFFKSQNEERYGNTGLGLALVKSLAQFLQGEIDIKSKPGEGTTVCVKFPLILKLSEHQSAAVIEGNKSLSIPNDFTLVKLETKEFNEKLDKNNNLKVLIAEDNIELNKFFKKHFSNKFQVIAVEDGQQALDKMNTNHPDIIISDVKMPNLSGIQFCKRVKSNPDTRHIPFLLLTAKNDEKLKLEALASGANAYLAKPFNLKELDLLVVNLLETSKNLEKRFSTIHTEKADPLPANNQDREFLRKIARLVEENHSDPKFGVESLANEAGISRSLLHIKMKKITALSALEYIKRIRMKKAIRLLKSGKSISEVAYNVGYSDPNYFSRAFKKEFNLTPTQYAERN